MAEYAGAPITEPPAVSNSRWIRRGIYSALRAVGGFRVVRWLTRGELRILCYHGISDTDLHRFAPYTFMSSATFRERMRHLRQDGYRVVGLDEALDDCSRGLLSSPAVVLTFDDSFKSTLYKAVPILEEFRFPATIYLTTYYAVKEQPIFRLVVRYMFWKSTKNEINLDLLGLPHAGMRKLRPKSQKRKLQWSIIKHGELHMKEEQRTWLCEKLGELLGVSYDSIVKSGELTLMDQDEVAQAASRGFDIQLHTHRHRLPNDPKEAHAELEDNRRVLKDWLGQDGRHFCYPSGIWKPNHIKVLEEAGMESAVTCKPGLNRPDTHPLLLHRFVDGEHITQVEFEAEMSGMVDLVRRNLRG